MADMATLIKPPAAMATKRQPAIAWRRNRAAESGAATPFNGLDAMVAIIAASKW